MAQIKITVYFESPDDLALIAKAAAKVQMRKRPLVSRYVAEAIKQVAMADLAKASKKKSQ